MTKKMLLSLALMSAASLHLVADVTIEEIQQQSSELIQQAYDQGFEEGRKEGLKSGMVAGIEAEDLNGDATIENPEETAEAAVEIEENMQELLNNPEELDKIMKDPEFQSFMKEIENNPEFAEQLKALQQNESAQAAQ